MFKRTFWFTTGATAGFGGAMWIRRQVLRTVRRYAPETLAAELGPAFALVTSARETHVTPWGKPQSFQYSVFRRE